MMSKTSLIQYTCIEVKSEIKKKRSLNLSQNLAWRSTSGRLPVDWEMNWRSSPGRLPVDRTECESSRFWPVDCQSTGPRQFVKPVESAVDCQSTASSMSCLLCTSAESRSTAGRPVLWKFLLLEQKNQNLTRIDSNSLKLGFLQHWGT